MLSGLGADAQFGLQLQPLSFLERGRKVGTKQYKECPRCSTICANLTWLAPDEMRLSKRVALQFGVMLMELSIAAPLTMRSPHMPRRAKSLDEPRLRSLSKRVGLPVRPNFHESRATHP